jgi:HEPN domain-containing protein
VRPRPCSHGGGGSPLRQEVRWWLDDAANDLAAAEDLLKSGRWSLAVFLARQAVEKTLKAAHLHLLRRPAPREHNLAALARVLPVVMAPDVQADLDWLNPHYTTARYVDAALGPPMSLYPQAMAEEAFARAQRVATWLTERLR